MIEYPKRLYRGGKGHTVNSLEEEQLFLGSSLVIEAPAPVEEQQEAQVADSEIEQKAEALEYLISKGYNKKAARSILNKEGLEAILKHKAEGTDPQE